ncbi:MAG: carboxypeptidase regulatory-like domain-containing protein, partial [Deltaproteobacteria bacterium]|nr:carboxypeptidase regulatory-like domain-containing protein [Deltaproteobacteria bacterium]
TGYYLSDRADYYNVVIQDNSGASDFIARFPPGTVIGAHQVLTVALDSTGFSATYAIAPDFDIQDPAMEPWDGAVGGSAGLTNGTETLVLFYWDSSADLVQDSDYIFWGAFSVTNPAVDKTGLALDGPDADDITSAYQDEIPEASQAGPPPPDTDGECIVRLDDTEGTEISGAGNGITGHDETSENLHVTWVVLNAPGPGCQAGEGLCGGSCIDILADASNCGACDNICSVPEVCCLASCSDLMTDPSNCGACFVVCGGGEECSLGMCCPSSQTNCSASCVDLMTDDANCGTCSNVCDVADDCSLGICCPIGQENCSGACADLQSDAANCGACSNACEAGESCSLSICCPTGQSNCSDTCVDMQNDITNCGGCDVTCDAGQNCCAGGCSDPLTDENNCGSCSVVCGVGEECLTGICCLSGQANCSGSCVDLQSDAANCGTCGNNCDVGQVCNQGDCALDCGELTMCGDSCVDTQTNPSHCGVCDLACEYSQAAGICQAGSCQMGACDNLFGDCNGNPVDGCEVDLAGDIGHCGDCDTVCSYANAVATCAVGTCQMGACIQGYDDCDTNDSNGCEADLTTPATCGSCFNVCNYAHASGSCDQAICSIGTCDTGYGDCNANESDGCETDLRDNLTDCGACDNACTGAQICFEGSCIDECPAGETMCGLNCADLQTDATNCGSCDHSCQPGELCIGANCVVPSYSVTGTVRDKQTQQELSGVQLSLGVDKDTISAIDGTYAFRDVEAGSYQLVVVVAGYASFTLGVTVADADLVQDIELEADTSSGCGCQAGANPQSPLWFSLLLLVVVVLRLRSGTI